MLDDFEFLDQLDDLELRALFASASNEELERVIDLCSRIIREEEAA